MNSEREKTCCFTGHRHIKPQHALAMPKLLDEELYHLVDKGVRNFITGGAIGFDTVAALKVLEMRERFGFIKLHLCLPCETQTRGWDERSIFVYNYILNKSDSREYLSKNYTSDCMFARNRRMVELSGHCVAYCTENRGGTAYTCTYALKNKLDFINLSDKLPRGSG